jgi:AcrR family transcriptional regulator/DNA-binding MarR family transcriptional regulator
MLNGGASTARRRAGAVGSVSVRRGAVLVSQAQRSRVLRSAVAVLHEHGYGQMSVARVTSHAGVSRRTFYDLFEDREDCFLAVFEDAISRAQALVVEAYARERGWREQTRAALRALLEFLDEEPGMSSLLVVDALKAGRRVQERRGEILAGCSAALHAGGSGAKPGRALPDLTGEGVTGAVLGVIHTRSLTNSPGPMVELLGPLMGVIVLPYLGPAAAQREISRPTPVLPLTPERVIPGPSSAPALDVLAGFPMRVTYRTLRVLEVISESPGASNRKIADQAGVADQGQISKLLARLEGLGLITNKGEGQPSGEPNAWHLTPAGQQVATAIQAQPTDRASGVRTTSSPQTQTSRGAIPSKLDQGKVR